MLTIRKTLERLGWPVDEMSDRQITQELYRRWFASRPENMSEEAPLSVASARGIIVSMASDGNLDSLCWAEGDRIPLDDVVSAEEKAIYVRRESGGYDHADRRRSKREETRDLVHWCLSGEDSAGCTGWLVNRSAEGMAFIAPAAEAPGVGDEIVPSIHSRTQGIIEAGPATVVRIEPLNGELALVCAHLIESTWPC
jgi:hypothetical protein